MSSWQKIKKDFWEVSRLETFDEQHGVFRIDAAEVKLREEDVPKLVSQKPWVCGLDATLASLGQDVGMWISKFHDTLHSD